MTNEQESAKYRRKQKVVYKCGCYYVQRLTDKMAEEAKNQLCPRCQEEAIKKKSTTARYIDFKKTGKW